MSTLSSTSTNDEVWAAYDDNASYEEDADRAKALAFITACRILIRRKPKRMYADGKGADFDEVGIREEMKAARAFVTRNPASTTPSVRFGDLSSFRD